MAFLMMGQTFHYTTAVIFIQSNVQLIWLCRGPIWGLVWLRAHVRTPTPSAPRCYYWAQKTSTWVGRVQWKKLSIDHTSPWFSETLPPAPESDLRMSSHVLWIMNKWTKPLWSFPVVAFHLYDSCSNETTWTDFLPVITIDVRSLVLCIS